MKTPIPNWCTLEDYTECYSLRHDAINDETDCNGCDKMGANVEEIDYDEIDNYQYMDYIDIFVPSNKKNPSSMDSMSQYFKNLAQKVCIVTATQPEPLSPVTRPKLTVQDMKEIPNMVRKYETNH